MLSDLEHQLETASLASKKLNQDAKAKGLSRVGSSLRREFSAFRKVLENSKSRLQELEAMKADLERMNMMEGPVAVLEPIEQGPMTLDSEREPALELVAPASALESREPECTAPVPMIKAKSFNIRLRSSTRSAMTTLESTPEYDESALMPVQMTKAKSFSKRLKSVTRSVGKSVKSPHWLPSLGNKKKFFPEEESRGDEEMEREIIDNIRKAVVEREIKKGIQNTTEECRTDCPPDTVRPVGYKSIHDRVEKLRLAFKQEEEEGIYEDKLETDPLSRNRSGLSLEVRERSFRTNLQVRALALSRDHSAKVAMGLVKRANDETDASAGNNDTENKKEETLAEFASRLERSIKMMKASDLGVEALDKEDGEIEDAAAVFQKDNLQSLKSRKEPMSLRIAKSLRLMRANSTGTVATAKKTEDPVETSYGSLALTSVDQPVNKTEMGAGVIKATLTDVTGPKAIEGDTVIVQSEEDVTNSISQQNHPAQESRRDVAMRQQSFHVDGWKDGLEASNAADNLSEEAIASQELKAREAYIKAMQIHQELIRLGKREESPEVIESKRLLQKCFAKIEFWEDMKDDLDVPPTISQNETTDAADALIQLDEDRVHVSALKIEHHGFKVSQDTSFIEAQEKKAREDYINAMREQQELILARVKADTFAWQQSQRRQKQCLAKLKYWEARNEAATGNRAEQDEPNIMIAPTRTARNAKFQMSNLTIAEQIARHDAKSTEEDDDGGNAGNEKYEDVAAPISDSARQDDEENRSESLLGYVAALMSAWLPSCANSNSNDCFQIPIPGLVTKSVPHKKHRQGGKKSRKPKTKATKYRTSAKQFPAGSLLCGGIDVVTLGSTENLNVEIKKEHDKKIENEAMDMLGSLTYDSFSVTTGATGEETLEMHPQLGSTQGTQGRGRYEAPSEEDDGSVVSFLIDGEAGGTKIFCM